MKKGLAVLLVLVMSMGTIAAALDPVLPSGEPAGQSSVVPLNPLSEDFDAIAPAVNPDHRDAAEDPMFDYLDTLGEQPKPPLKDLPGDENRIPIKSNVDCILMHADRDNEWSPIPNLDQDLADTLPKVTLENEPPPDEPYEIHGKMFETIQEENTTYFDDIGIPDMAIRVFFAGELIAFDPSVTGDNSSAIDPFIDSGNGTFAFTLEPNLPADRYELLVEFDGWVDPTSNIEIYTPMSYKAIIYINHPTEITFDVSPNDVVVGNTIDIGGALQDDTGVTIKDEGIQIRFDNMLLGDTSDGVYLDNVRVTNAASDDEDFFDNFDQAEPLDWSTYSAPTRGVPNQWERGQVKGADQGGTVGPLRAKSAPNVWGTNLNRNYDRGAWCFLVSPRLNFTADDTYLLSFYGWWSVHWADDFAYLQVSVDGGNTWDEENIIYFMGTPTKLKNDDWNDWTFFDNINLTRYKGSDNVKVAFVFHALDITKKVHSDGTFSFSYIVPMETTADKHDVFVVFKGNVLFRAEDEKRELKVRRILRFVFESNDTLKVGHRNNPLQITAALKDNMGEVPKMNIRGDGFKYVVNIYWDPTWTIDDGVGQLKGSPVMDRDTGRISLWYVVGKDQVLGHANVTFSTTKLPPSVEDEKNMKEWYYTQVTETDIYYVKAEVYVALPAKEELQGFRGQTLPINGELRVLPDQSIDDFQLGDPVSGEFIKVFWANQPIGNRRTNFAGAFSVDYLVPATHELGDVLVMFEYEGQSHYEPVTFYTNYTVVSETFITIEDQDVFKGEWVYINGTVKDDKGQPVANMPIYVIWKRAPEIGRATSKTDGTFSLLYYIEFEDKVGNVSVIARFKGTKIYLANETTANYRVKVNTILERRDRTYNLIRGQQVQISGKLYEDWGGFKGVEVQREIVTLLIDEIIVSYKRSAYDGSVLFTAPIEPDKFSYGEVELVLDFNGTEFYEPSRNITKVVIKANAILTFSEFRVDGELFDPNIEIVLKGQEVYGRLLLQDDNYQPIALGNVSVYYKDEGQRARKRLIDTGLTDTTGYFEFNWTFQVNTIGNKTFIAEYDGLIMDTFLKQGDLVILPAQEYYNITYDVPPPEPLIIPWYVYALVGVALIGATIGIVWSSFYYRKRRQLKKMQRIIRRAADRLVAGNVYSATIFRAYREMAHTLKAYGQLRKDSETFREFEDAVREALPIDAESLDDFLTVLEEARYSEHEIGETQKDTAIEALRGVQTSIEKILLTDEDIAKISRKGEVEDMIEPEIIVAEETAAKAPPRGQPPTQPKQEPPKKDEGSGQ